MFSHKRGLAGSYWVTDALDPESPMWPATSSEEVDFEVS